MPVKATLLRWLPPAYLLRSAVRFGAAGAVWIAGYETTAHILAVLAVMSLLGPIEINVAKDAVAWAMPQASAKPERVDDV